MSGPPREGRLAGIDYGHVRIGIAVSDHGQQFASPFQNYTRGDPSRDGEFFRHLVAEQEIVGFVVGLPLHNSGEESRKSQEVREFADWLTQLTSRPVQFHDERFTTVEAELALNAAQMTRKKRKRRLDMIAAQMILASYLESDRCDPSIAPLADD